MSLTCREPKLRFKEFRGEWVEKKFSEVTKINQGLQIVISERFTKKVKDSYFYITNEFLKKNNEKKYFIKNPSESVLCDENDVLMTRTGNTGQVVTNVNGAFHNNFFKIKYCKNINKSFLVYFLRLQKTQNMILRYAGTSTIPDLNHSDFYRLKINLPSKQEQEKIASFLSGIDEKIESLTCKEKLLQKYKKGVMQKIFNQEIGFKAKDGSEYAPWEEKRFGNISTITMGQSPNSKSYNHDKDGMFLIQGNADIKDRKSNPRQWTREPTKVCEVNDLILTVRAPVGTIAKSLHNACIGRGVCSIKNNKLSNIDFLYQYLLFFEQRWVSLEQGSTFTAVSSSDIKNLKVNVPSIQEQTKIANFLSAIDEKLLHVKKQLESTKEFKKALLQQMFV